MAATSESPVFYFLCQENKPREKLSHFFLSRSLHLSIHPPILHHSLSISLASFLDAKVVHVDQSARNFFLLVNSIAFLNYQLRWRRWRRRTMERSKFKKKKKKGTTRDPRFLVPESKSSRFVLLVLSLGSKEKLISQSYMCWLCFIGGWV